MTAAARALVPAASARSRRPRGRHARGIRVVVATHAVDAVTVASEAKPVVTIRRAVPKDVPVVTRILVEAADGAVSTQSLATYAREAAVVDELPGETPEQLALVAERAFPTPSDPPKVVGVVGLLLDDALKPTEMKLEKEVGYVTNLAVDGSARRSGIGAALLAAAESTAEHYGCVEVACRVDEGNDIALAMYDKNGYDALEPRKLRRFRRLMGRLYALAGVAHLLDLLVLDSVLPVTAGAPPWALMDPTQRLCAFAWCALGPIAWLCTAKGPPAVGDSALVAYGVLEVTLCVACAVAYGAVGGDAATGAVGVQVAVAGCALWMKPGRSPGRLSLGKELRRSAGLAGRRRRDGAVDGDDGVREV